LSTVGAVFIGALLTVGDRWLAVSVPGVVAVVVVKLGLLVVLLALAAEGVEGGSEACGCVDGGRRWGVAVRWMRTSEAEGSLALLLLVLLMLLLLDWEKVAVLLLTLVKDGCLEAGFGVMGCLDGLGEAALAVPRVGGGLWEAFLERKERRRMKRGLWCEY
jgi:hypothetical protein